MAEILHAGQTSRRKHSQLVSDEVRSLPPAAHSATSSVRKARFRVNFYLVKRRGTFNEKWLDALASTFYSSPIDTRLALPANPVVFTQRTFCAVHPLPLLPIKNKSNPSTPDGGQILT